MFEKGELISEGKTKKVFKEKTRQDAVIIENKTDITAFDNEEFTKQFGTKAEYATTTTCRVFELLQRAEIPVAYAEQISETEFVTRKCEMIPLEVVARRYAVGSYLKRHPELDKGENNVPHRFHRLVVEFFLKTTKGKLVDWKGNTLIKDLDAKKGEEDPIITDPYSKLWELCHPKKPSWNPDSILNRFILSDEVLKNPNLILKMDEIIRRIFLTLEGAWAVMGHRIIDMKVEFGITTLGDLVVADVIDNDSWRLRSQDWEELSKESFRQGEELSKVEIKYGIVARLAEKLRVPKQVLVLWRGSDEDSLPEVPNIAGVDVVKVVISGHKAPRKSAARLKDMLAEYPEGGVIIAFVGMSNGLGPTLSARTSWLVISVPLTVDKRPHDVWSSLEMPSQVPNATILKGENAILAALNVLAQKNPVAYMHRQYAIEELDM